LFKELITPFNKTNEKYISFNSFSSLFSLLDGIDDTYPGTVSIQRIKKLISDLKQCVYMEAAALTGDNVDAIFQTGNH
jgi:hypothetical protein